MKSYYVFLIAWLIPFCLWSQHQVAITIDDLPISTIIRTEAHFKAVNQKIVTTLTEWQVPAIGFVNEGKLYQRKTLVPSRVDLLRMWLDAGLELGNHGFAHKDYNNVSVADYQADILTGEKITKALQVKRGMKMQYFRNPYLHTGNSSEKRARLDSFLLVKGYQIAPVTLDNSEWIYARAYENALLRQDSTLMRKIGDSYVSYMEEKTAYYEQQCQQLFGRNIQHILLIHSNTLNGDYLDELLTMFTKRGYTFVSLAEALTDPAYQTSDTFMGRSGISWIHRWAITQQKDKAFFAGEPACPQFVQDVAEIQE